MNMPDPQAMTSNWMSQFADPATWQSWMKLPEPDINPLAGILKDVGAHINPAALDAIKTDYLQKAAALWQDMVMMKTPELNDRRFAAPEWQANPLSAYSAASYLLNSRFLLEMAEAVEATPRDKQKIRFAVQQMVDAMSPANFLATNPEAQQHLIESKGESLTKGLTNMLADLQKGRISQSDESAFEVGRNVATTPGQVVFENALFQLIQYAPSTATVHAVPLVMIPPCINKFYILDLQPENSVVRYAVEQGNSVFLVSWRNPGKELENVTWDDYVEMGAIQAINVSRAISGSAKVSVFGFCVGGTIASSALAVLAARGEQPAASLTLLTTLLDYEDTGVLDVFIDENQVAKREKSLANGGLLPGKDLATTFSSLRPNDLVWNYVQSNYLKGKNPAAFDLLYWNADSTNLPGPMFTFYLRQMYLENNLRMPGKVATAGVKVDLGAIDAPTFIYGSRDDHIVPWTAAFKSMGLLNPGKPNNNRFVLGASGHIAGVINPHAKGKRSHWIAKAKPNGKGAAADPDAWLAGATELKGSWWSAWAAFLAEHGGKNVKPPAKLGNKQYAPIEAAPGRYVKVRAEQA
ncbi:class I poly(R)-hydroxyalkanoic acid synthase [Massilia sp. TWR1-2-2]|uniref:class I poly(R)-hydroxyalkanoic acid synthase n=1 Tax=Massilia sp. TWR1-2-2 TaxID=2804584 RepID=UPI003CF62F22